MTIANIHEAKTHLSRFLEQVAAGEEIIISKAGKPVAKLIPYRPSPKPRKPGLWKGKIKIAADFDELPPEIAERFGVITR